MIDTTPYYSHKLIPAQSNYAPHGHELLPIFKSACKWRYYVDGSQVTVWTDHKPLKNIWTQPHLSQCQTRWLEWLSELPLKIVYRSGKEQVVSDTLSRCPFGVTVLSPEHLAKYSQFLRRFAPQHIVSSVIFSDIKSMSPGQDVDYLACPHFRVAHLDTHSPLDERTCGNCGKSWKESRHAWGNPLGIFAMQLKSKQLMVSGDAQFPVLALLIVKPSFLAQVFAGQSDPNNKKMAHLYTHGYLSDAPFAFCQAGGFSLLYHIVQDSSLQLIIPGS